MHKGTATYQDEDFPRLRWTRFEMPGADDDDGRDVIAGLSATPKTLPARYFYDDRGSALFEQITRLPEYYPTRTEQAILDERAADVAEITGPAELIELGSGSARKTRTLIDAYERGDHPLCYLPVDVSAGIMRDSSQALLRAYPALDVWALVGTYEQALAQLPPRRLSTRMAIFLGSTIGNLSSEELGVFLDNVRRALGDGGYFLVGADLQKPVPILEAAYNDSAGVTAAFNRNMLRHLNERFDGDFDVDGFDHKAVYDREEQQIEMHLVSRGRQQASLSALDLTVEFDPGESVRTEISRKFHVPDITERFAKHGFAVSRTWTDERDWFALFLLRAV